MSARSLAESFINGNRCHVADTLSVSHPVVAARTVLLLCQSMEDHAETLIAMLATRAEDMREQERKRAALHRWRSGMRR